MATFTFDGSQSLTTEFNASVDRVILDVALENVASFTENDDTVTLVTTAGVVLTLTSTNFESLTNDNFLSDFNLFFGTDAGDTPATFTAETLALGLDGVDAFTGSANDDLFFGNEGADALVGGGGADRLYGGMGIDAISQTSAGDGSLLVGGLAADVITVNGTFTGSVFTGGAGDGLTGDVTIYGGNGTNDTADGADRIGAEVAVGGSVEIYGNAGNDTVSVLGGGDATIYGGFGNDSIAAAVNQGFVAGGAGIDNITITTTGDAASVTVYGGNGLNDSADGADTLSVTLAGDGHAVVYGNGGNDTVVIGGTAGGQFEIFGGQGNDTIGGAAGGVGSIGSGSSVVGGLGLDVINVELVNSTAAGAGPATVTIYGGNEATDAADGADTITVALTGTGATAQSVEIYGNAGADAITLTGAGAATVFGGQGADTISVGTTADDATGVYTLTGGAGADLFDFANIGATPDFSAATAATVSKITDLNLDADTISFNDSIEVVFDVSANATTGASLSAAAVNAFNTATATSAAAQDAVVLFAYEGNKYLVHADTAAVGADIVATDIDNLVQVTGVTGTLTTSDFVA